MSNPGLTKGEHWALIILALLILGGILVRIPPGDGTSGDVWIETGPNWKPIPAVSNPAQRRADSSETKSQSPPAARPASALESAPGLAEVSPGSGARNGRIDLNSADARALESLPGIGKVKAQAIIDFRNAVGPFKSVEDLDNVPGIGPKTLNNLRLLVEVSGRPDVQGKGTEASPADRETGPAVRAQAAAKPRNRDSIARRRIDLNHAEYDKLLEIPGIGPVLAGRILEYREEHLFRRPSDLIRIKGIGPTSFESMEPYVTVAP